MSAKNKRCDELQLSLLQNEEKRFDDPSQEEFSNTKQEKQQLSGENSLKKINESSISMVHGINYQLKVIMLFLQTALDKNCKFELSSEDKSAEKFDDIILKDTEGQYRLLQIKHKHNPDKNKIDILELFSENDRNEKKISDAFNLNKYFMSFHKIIQKEKYKDKIKDLIIYTNTDFKKDYINKNKKAEYDELCNKLLIELEKYDAILNIDDGKCYKLNLNTELKNKLKKCFFKQFGKELAAIAIKEEKIKKKKCLDLNNDSLTKEVSDMNLSEHIKVFLEAYKTEASKIWKSNTDIWDVLDKKTFVNFGIEKGQLLNYSVDIEIEDFFKKLVFAVKQPDDENLNKYMSEKIFNSLDYLTKSNLHTEIIFDHFYRKVSEWLKTAKETLSNNHNFIKNGKEIVKKIMLSIPDFEYNNLIKKVDISFDSTCCELQKIKDFLYSETDKIFLISSEQNIFLSQIKVYQALNEQQLSKTRVWKLDMLLHLRKFEDYKMQDFFQENLLIIICTNEFQIEDQDTKELYDELTRFIKEDNHKKIIFITQTHPNIGGNSILVSSFESNFENNYKKIEDKTNVEDLNKKYLHEILLKKTIIFQGQEKNLEDLINIRDKTLNNDKLSKEEIKRLGEIIKPNTLNEIIFNEKIVIGNKLSDLKNPNSPYYNPYYIDIPRTFNYQIMDTNNLKMCIEKRERDLFAFSLTKRDFLETLLPTEKNKNAKEFKSKRFFILDEDLKENFQILCNNNRNKSVHWLEYIHNDKFAVKYSNNLSDLRKFMKIEKLENEIENNSIVIIVGCPGVGKSTVLTEYTQKLYPLSWLIRINLKVHQQYMINADFNNSEGIIEFFSQSNLVNLKTALAKSLLEHYLKYREIILLLDGYDEIHDINQKMKVIQLLIYFKSKGQKIWLTARLNEQHKLEDALGTFAYLLNPFDEEKQEEFLIMYLRRLKELDTSNKKKIDTDKLSKEILNYFHKEDLMKEDCLIGIVLQIQIIAEIFYCKFKDENEDKKFDVFEVGVKNISDLYERFIECQYVRYFIEKCDVKLLDKCSQNALANLYTKAYGYEALNVLFFRDESCMLLKKLQSKNEKHKFSQDVLNSIGLIKHFENGMADFVHFTYAEYFVAKLLANMLSKEPNHFKYKLIRDLILRNIFLDRNMLIHKFLDEIQERNNNNDVKNNWETIQNCDLLKKVKVKRVLQLYKPTSKDNLITITKVGSYSIDGTFKIYNMITKHNATSNKTLHDLRIDINPWIIKNNYNIDIVADTYGIVCVIKDVDLYNSLSDECKNSFDRFKTNSFYELYQVFLNETDIQELETTLDFVIKFNVIFNLTSFCIDELYIAVEHYFIQARLQNKLNVELEKKIELYINVHYFPHDVRNLQNLKKILNLARKIKGSYASPNASIKEKHLKRLINLLIPRKAIFPNETFFDTLQRLNKYMHYLFVKFDENRSLIKDINSIKSVQKKCQNKILNFLKIWKIQYNYAWLVDLDGILENMKYLHDFFINIICHSDIIDDTKLFINEMYVHQKCSDWTLCEGIIIFRFINIYTSEMSERFQLALEDIYTDKRRAFISDYFIPCIINILDMNNEVFLHMDKLAFLKMLTFTLNITIKFEEILPLNFNQLERTLKLLKNVLNEQHESALLTSVKYLNVLKIAGLKLINIPDDRKILILDPVSEFEFVLSSDYKNQIIKQLIQCYNDKVGDNVKK